jgi:hypothetical protein
MAEGVLDCFHHLRQGIDDLVFGIEPRLHFSAQVAQALLEVVEGFVVKL